MVTRVASGTHDMGFADLAALMEFHANNPTAPNKPVAVMMVYNNAGSGSALKKAASGPTDLKHEAGPPVFDAGLERPSRSSPDQQHQQRGLDLDGPLREDP